MKVTIEKNGDNLKIEYDHIEDWRILESMLFDAFLWSIDQDQLIKCKKADYIHSVVDYYEQVGDL
ncbi:MAG: hypothetical protein MUE85_19240 [Microscillaceae bacterium]|jgi:hypothetical protein|nr:hypothetical protein [Microscillaceae bacterium]